jgi:hypothetical protein
VANTFNPGSPGTRISDREGGSGVRSVALRRGLSLAHVPTQGCQRCLLLSRCRCGGHQGPGERVGGRRCSVRRRPDRRRFALRSAIPGRSEHTAALCGEHLDRPALRRRREQG